MQVLTLIAALCLRTSAVRQDFFFLVSGWLFIWEEYACIQSEGALFNLGQFKHLFNLGKFKHDS